MSSFDANELADIREIEQVKYAYMRLLDTKEFDGLTEVLTPDAVADWSGGKIHREGRQAIIDYLHETMSDHQFLSSHRVHHPEIHLIGPDSATGTWALEDTVVMGQYGLLLHGAAFYTDTYRRTDDGWRISHTGYRRTFEYIIPTAKVDGFRLTASWWGTDGQSELV